MYGTEGVYAKLVIFFCVDLYSAPALEVNDVQNAVRHDKRIAGAVAFRDIEGAVNTLFNKYGRLFESFRLLHYKISIIGCVFIHFRVFADRLVFGSSESVVEFPLRYAVGEGTFRGVA